MQMTMTGKTGRDGVDGGGTRRRGGGREEVRRQTLERKYLVKGRNGLVLLCICVLKCLRGSKTDKERCLNLLECLCVSN